MTESEERTSSDLVNEAEVRALEAWDHFRVFCPARPGAHSKDSVDTRWALTWEEVGGEKTVKARLVAKGIKIRIFARAMWKLRVA